ncbi:MAG: hypothetical protein NZ959_00665 [Armatimonadetes bacterium]|nr:hypothetical protein [Armatimonadota bacterium]MDW8121099.1 hypothetical protein [Armatimonadota bacterium]
MTRKTLAQQRARKDWDRQIEQICKDRQRGAVPLTKATIRLFLQMQRAQVPLPKIQSAAERIYLCHQAMAPLWHLARTIAQGDGQILSARLRQFAVALDEQSQRVVHRVAERLVDGVILTHSFSSLVFKSLLRAKKLGKRVTILCTESRPGSEGVLLARRLTTEGLPVTLIPDIQAFSWMGECHLFLIGADALLPDGVVHKVGTFAIAREAKRKKVPVWVVGTSLKVLPHRYQDAIKGQSSPLTHHSVPQDRTLYDLTPWNYVALLFMDDEIIKGSAVEQRLLDRGLSGGQK